MESGIVASIVRAYSDTLCTLAADMDILKQTAMSSMVEQKMGRLDFESLMQSLLGIAKGTPQYWALEAVERLASYSVGLGDILLNIGVLTGMALVLFAVSMLIYNKKQRA